MPMKDCLLGLALVTGVLGQKSASPAPSEDAVDLREDGGYGFRYRNRDPGGHYGEAVATPDNTVSGKFGYREPGSGRNLETRYTAGERGFRAQGPTIHRRMDLGQAKIPYNPPVAKDSPSYNPTYSTYYDPNEDSSYHFDFATKEYKRTETGGPLGQIVGAFSFTDDIGDIHNVEFEAGSQTGFHVKTAYPDSNHNYNEVYFTGDGKVPLRGRTSIQRGVDGSYRFTTHSQDQRRSEVKDALGNTRGSYTYIDKDGIQRTVQYIAGPNIGYKIVNQGLGPSLDPLFAYVHQNYVPPSLTAGGGKPGFGSGGGLKPGFVPGGSLAPPVFGGSPGEIVAGKPPNSSKPPRPSLPAGPPFGFESPPIANPIPDSDSFGQDSSFKPGGLDTESVAGSDESDKEEGSNDNSGSSQDSEPSYPPTGQKPAVGFKDPIFTPSQKPTGAGQGKPKKPPSSNDDFLSSTAPYPPQHAGFPEEDPESPKPFSNPSFKPFTIEDNLFLQRPFSSLPPAGSNSRFYPDRVDDLGKDSSFVPLPEYIDDVLDKDGTYSEAEFRGFPPGISVKGRIQSLDINPYGTKVPAPGEALEQFGIDRDARASS